MTPETYQLLSKVSYIQIKPVIKNDVFFVEVSLIQSPILRIYFSTPDDTLAFLDMYSALLIKESIPMTNNRIYKKKTKAFNLLIQLAESTKQLFNSNIKEVSTTNE